MAHEHGKSLRVTTGVVVVGLVAGAGYGGYNLRQWADNWNRAAEKSVAPPQADAAIAPQLLTWQQAGRISTGLASVKSFAILKDGSVIVAGERTLRLLSAKGDILRDIPLAGMPQAVAAMKTPQGPVFFAGMKDRVEMYDAEGKLFSSWAITGDNAFVTCVTAGADGRSVWVADAGRRIVEQYDLTGKLLREVGRENPETHAPGLVVPSAHLDVALAADGTVWVNNPGRHEMEAFDAHGEMIRQWGRAGSDIRAFAGCCNPTDFFLLGDGRIVTAEKAMPRVKVFDSAGVLQSVIATDFAPEAAGIDVAGDSAGRVWILDPVSHDLRVYAPKAPAPGGLAGNL